MMDGTIRLFEDPPSGLQANASRANDAVVTPTGGGEKAQAPSAQFIVKNFSGSGFRVHK
jgi:hypothetical protein